MNSEPLKKTPAEPGAPWAGPQVLVFFSLYLLLQILAAQLALDPNIDPNIDPGETADLENTVTSSSEVAQDPDPAGAETNPVLDDPLDDPLEEKAAAEPATLLTPEQARPLFKALAIFNGGLIGLILLYLRIWRKQRPETPSVLLGAHGTVGSCLKTGAIACLLWIPIHLLISVIWGIVLQQFGHEPIPQEAVSLFGKALVNSDRSLVSFLIIQIVLVAPWLEELLFRGLLFRWLLGYRSVLTSAIISGIIFGLMHDSLASIFPISCLGIALAWLAHKSGNLLTSIFFHMFFNTIMITLIIAAQLQEGGK